MFGDEIEKIEMIHPTSGQTLGRVDQAYIYPAVHDRLPRSASRRPSRASGPSSSSG